MKTNAAVQVALPPYPTPVFQVMPGGKPFPKVLLEHLYLEEGMGLKRVAEKLGIGPQRVRRELVAYGLPIRPSTHARKLSVEQLETAKAEIVAEKERLQQELRDAMSSERAALRQEIADLEEIWADTDRAWVEAVKERDEARSQLRAQEAFVEQLQTALAERKTLSLSSDVQALLREVVAGPKNPEQCLRLVAAAYPERVVLLDSALRAAQDAENFQRVGGLADLLRKWVTVYYDALVSGGGDEQGHALLGWSFAAKNGDGAQKSFEYKGRKLVMTRHLRIGTKESFNETIRVFFAWDSVERKLVIGWCGKHT